MSSSTPPADGPDPGHDALDPDLDDVGGGTGGSLDDLDAARRHERHVDDALDVVLASGDEPVAPPVDEAELAKLNAAVAREVRIQTTLESKSFSRLAWERFCSNRQAVSGGVVVLFLAFIGVFAPLLANSLPYRIEVVRPDLYEQAYWVIAIDGDTAVTTGTPVAAAKRTMLGRNFALMRGLVADDFGARLDAWWERFGAAVLGDAVDADAGAALIEEYYAEFDPELATFVPRVYHPALRTLGWGEVAFMVGFVAFVGLMPLRRWLGGPTRTASLAVAAFALAGALWWMFVPRMADATNYKAMVRADPTISARFPPVRYGENENITEQVKEPPTWSTSPERAARGFLERLRLAAAAAPDGMDAGRWREQRLDDARLQAAPAFHAAVSLAAFERGVETIGLLDVTDFRWDARSEDRRWARLEGAALADAGRELPLAMTFAITRGNWRLLGIESDTERLGDLTPAPTTDDYHWLGTDANGRDLLARMIYGTRIAMSIGIVAVSIYCSIGIILGALAGFYGGWIDITLSRFIEVIICFPTLFLILILVSFGSEWPIPPIFLIMVVIGLTGWPGVARLVRGEFLRLTNEEFVQAVRAVGGGHLRIIFKHVLPNAMGPVLVSASFGIASAILYESSLSFIGLGVKPPQASWGLLLFQAREDLLGMWWMTMFPGAAIFVTVTCFNLVGEGVRDALDPKHVEGS